jgi:hypothetical protein
MIAATRSLTYACCRCRVPYVRFFGTAFGIAASNQFFTRPHQTRRAALPLPDVFRAIVPRCGLRCGE